MIKNSGVLLVLTGLLFSPWKIVAQPSVEDFVKHPHFDNSKISPSGKYLALTGRKGDVQGILVINLETMDIESGTHFGEHEDVWDFFWANDERLLIEPALRTPATMSYKAPTGELVGMNADGSNLRLLTGFRKITSRTGTYIRHQNSITARSEIFDLYSQDRDLILVQASSKNIRGGYSQAFLLNVNTGSARVVGRSKVRYGSFIADENGLPAINIGANADNETELYYRDDSEQAFELLSRSRFGNGLVEPVAALPDGSGYYVLENISADTKSLSLWQPDQSSAFKTIFRHPQVDIDSVVTGAHDHQLIAVKYYDPLPNYFYPDDTLPIVQQHQRLRLKYPDRDVVIESVTDDMSKAVINITGDIYPSVYYLLNVKTGDMEKIFSSRPELQNVQLATMRPVSFPSRDGLQLQGFLTLPKNIGEQAGLPLVVLVHGGPYGLRDQWGYDFEVQLLASRGYAVLQVNFRGSPGSGLKFQAAGIGEWGAKMQDDITDATRWVINKGVVSPNRVCIYGSSYGGYAALMGVVREPDLYRCAIGYGGIYDLEDLFNRGAIQATASGESYLDQVLGRDESQLVARSPYRQAEKIKAKVLIAHGRKDAIAPYQQAKALRQALKAAGNKPEYFIESKEGHGFFGQRSRERYYDKLLAFLDENIGNRHVDATVSRTDLKN
jgi:acylaminoacyl-peptidase